MDCQAGLLGGVVARHKGIAQKKLVVSVEKSGELVWKINKFSKEWQWTHQGRRCKKVRLRAEFVLQLLYGLYTEI